MKMKKKRTKNKTKKRIKHKYFDSKEESIQEGKTLTKR